MTRIDRRRPLAATAAVLVVMAVAGRAGAADNLRPAIATAGDGIPSRGGIPPGSGLWQASAGFRTAAFHDAGYDPFSDNDAFVQFSASVMRAFGAPGDRGPSPALGLTWENGSADATARGVDARLSLMRVALALEGRLAPRRGIYLLVRAAPGLVRASATVIDAATPAPLTTAFSTFSLDASAGVAARLNPGANAVGLWLLADAGYGWAGRHALTLSPRLAAADQDKAGTTSLGSLATRGAFLRMSLGLSY